MRNTTNLFVKLLCAFLIETFNKQKEVSDFVKIKKHFFYDKKIKLKIYLSMKKQILIRNLWWLDCYEAIHNNLTT